MNHINSLREKPFSFHSKSIITEGTISNRNNPQLRAFPRHNLSLYEQEMKKGFSSFRSIPKGMPMNLKKKDISIQSIKKNFEVLNSKLQKLTLIIGNNKNEMQTICDEYPKKSITPYGTKIPQHRSKANSCNIVKNDFYTKSPIVPFEEKRRCFKKNRRLDFEVSSFDFQIENNPPIFFNHKTKKEDNPMISSISSVNLSNLADQLVDIFHLDNKKPIGNFNNQSNQIKNALITEKNESTGNFNNQSNQIKNALITEMNEAIEVQKTHVNSNYLSTSDSPESSEEKESEDDNIINEIMKKYKLGNYKKKNAKKVVTFDMDNNIDINYNSNDLITNISIRKKLTGSELFFFPKDYNKYLNKLRTFKPTSIMKGFNEKDIQINKEFTQNLEIYDNLEYEVEEEDAEQEEEEEKEIEEANETEEEDIIECDDIKSCNKQNSNA